MTLIGGLGVRVGRGVVTAAGRAVLQLAVVSAVIVAVVRSLWLSAAFVLLMLVVAAATSARRMTGDRSGLLAVVPIAGGAALVLAIRVVDRRRPAGRDRRGADRRDRPRRGDDR